MKTRIYRKIIKLYRFFKIKRRRTGIGAYSPELRRVRRCVNETMRVADKNIPQLNFFEQAFTKEHEINELKFYSYNCEGKPYLHHSEKI